MEELYPAVGKSQRRMNTKTKFSPARDQAFTLPEVMIAAFILAFVAISSARLTNNALIGMKNSANQTLADAAISKRIEQMRERSFNLFCKQGCDPTQLSKELEYQLDLLKPKCGSLGAELEKDLSDQKLLDTITVASIPPIEITIKTPTKDGNQLQITLESNTLRLKTTSVLVPHAEGWCP